MASTTFIDDQTVIYAAWCNDVNNAVYNLIGSAGTPATTVAQVRTNLGLGSAALQNTTSVSFTGGAINGITIGATTPSSASFTSLSVSGAISQTSAASFNQQVPNITRTISGGGAAIREIGDIATLGGPGSIEYGYSFNANVDVGTGAWFNRDIADKNCWVSSWTGSTSQQHIWFSTNNGTLNPPTWVMKYEFDCVNDVMTVNVRSKLSSIAPNLITVITNYSVAATDYTILANAASGELTVTLPSAILNLNRILVVKRINATNNVIVASVAGSIDGAVSRTLNTQWMTERYQSNGTDWFII